MGEAKRRRDAAAAGVPADREATVLDIPPGWGDDDLTKYFDIARINLYAEYVGARSAYADILATDQMLFRFLSEMEDVPDSVTPFLALRSFAAFRAASQLSLAGQWAEGLMVLRGALETAMYAFYIHTDRTLQDVWMARGTSEAARKASRKAFTWGNVIGSLEASHPDLAMKIALLYELTIDYGAHPNPHSLFGALAMREEERGDESLTHLDVHFFAQDELIRDFSRTVLVRVGIGVLKVFGIIFPNRAEAMQLEIRLAPLARRY